MALNKPNVGQSNWGPALNAALDYLDGRIDDIPAGATGPQGPAGPAGEASSAALADFVFTTVENPDFESTMTVTNNSMVLKTVVNTEASGNIKLESAQDIVLNANGNAYVGDVSIQDNRIATIGDVQAASTADFVFTSEEGQSTISLPSDKQMRIQAGEDSDLYLTAGDDLYIQTLGNGDDIHLNAADDIRFTSNNEYSANQEIPSWRMDSEGRFQLPGNGYISNPYAETFTPQTGTVFAADNYLNDQSGLNQATSIALPVSQDTLWFINNYTFTSPVTVTFADSTTADVTTIYDATSQGTPAVIFQWNDERNKTFAETFPLTVSVQYNLVQYGASTIVLDPEWYGNDQKVVIDATAPNHIHIRAGGEIDNSTAELILGGENTHVRLSDASGSVEILGTDITISSYAAPSSLNINTYSGAVINSARTSTYAPEDKLVATLGDFPYSRVNVPESSLGQAGDVAHLVADDITHHYFCTGAYDGATHIWKRIAWSNDTWPGV